jgi:hypothetical protein
MIAKKQCKNDPTLTYTGKESSPLGLGYSASVEAVGTRMTGRDQTLWMVGMKNGVRVWNRVPTELAANATPLTKDEPVLGDAKETKEVEEESKPGSSKDAMPQQPIPIAKKETKKKETKKKVTEPKTEVEPEDFSEIQPVVAEDFSEIQPVVPEAPVNAPAPAPKKKVVKKKPAAVVEEAVAKDDAAEEPKKAETKAKKAPTTFNLYMSWRTKQIATEAPEMSHKERFGRAAAEWREMDDETKKAAVAQATAAK